MSQNKKAEIINDTMKAPNPSRVFYTRPNGTRGVKTVFHDATRTQQQFLDDTDVNKIMSRFIKTGQITHLNSRQGAYADLTSAEGYFESLNQIQKANDAFDLLPSQIRTRFQNDPSQLLEFIHDPKNYDEAVKLGIFDPKLPPPTPNQSIAPQTPSLNDESNDESTPTPTKTKKS